MRTLAGRLAEPRPEPQMLPLSARARRGGPEQFHVESMKAPVHPRRG